MPLSSTRDILTDAARRVVRRAGLQRRPTLPTLDVPKLSTSAIDTEPTVWMLAPDWNRPSGGVRKLYRAVDVLNESGIPAAIVHERPRFACTWFEHDTRITAARDVRVAPRDVIVVPEIYWRSIRNLPTGRRQVIYNQNAYLTLDSLAIGGEDAAVPYVDNPDLVAVIAVSEENAGLLSYAFPGVPVTRIRHGLDPAIHHPPASPPPMRIAYMPRRRGAEASQVLALLAARGALAGWEVVAIDRSSEAEVADLLRTARVFLSFSEREGFGLPPCEALACGCLVVGFDGFAGREFFRPPFAVAVENGDVVAFARAAEDMLRRVTEEPEWATDAAAAGAAFAFEQYSVANERDDLIDVFAPMMGLQCSTNPEAEKTLVT